MQGRIAGDEFIIALGITAMDQGVTIGGSNALNFGGTSLVVGGATVIYGGLTALKASSDLGWAMGKLIELQRSTALA